MRCAQESRGLGDVYKRQESARAGMRRIVKRLLRKYDYPPEGQEDALSTIMKQCDMWSENS